MRENMSSQHSVINLSIATIGSLLTLDSLMLLFIHGSLGQDTLLRGNEGSEKHYDSFTSNKSPSYECSGNMIWMEEYDSEGFCICLPGHLFSEEFGRCFKQYTQGPCEIGENFVLPANETVAKCVDNPCPGFNKVSYKGECYDLNVTGGPCGPREILKISDDSNEPHCVNRAVSRITAPCAPGMRIDKNGKCRVIL